MGSEVLTFISTVKNLTLQAPRSNKHFYECKNIAILKLRFCSCLVETFVQLKNYFSADNLLSAKLLRLRQRRQHLHTRFLTVKNARHCICNERARACSVFLHFS